MTEAEWLTCANLDWMFATLRDAERANYRRLRLYTCACCRLLPGFLDSEPDRESLELAELEADGLDGGREFGDEVYDIRWYRRDAWNSASRAITSHQEGLWETHDLHNADETKRQDVLARGYDQLATLLREVFGNPFRPVDFRLEWRTETAVLLARRMYESRDFSAMPILADALQDAGCDEDSVLSHCRDDECATHVRGCWVVDLLLGKF